MMVEEVKNWLRPFFKEDLDESEVVIKNNDSKDTGYMSGIIFVTLKKTEKKGTNTNIDLVIKKGTDVEAVRKSIQVREFFLTETFMYEKVFPTFDKLQAKRGLKLFQSVPKFYGKILLENSEVIIFNNLQSDGYTLYDRKKSMNVDHCKLVLKAYAELHSLSFALKDQDREAFDTLANSFVDAFRNWVAEPSMESYMLDNLQNVLESLEINGDHELLNFIKEELKDIYKQTLAILNGNDEQSVFLHGDNWNNNYLFKYGENNNLPVSVKILDWQLAAVRSPLIDVGKFLFSVCSQTEFDQLNVLLNYYYSVLSESLINLGSNPDKIFSYADFKRHWSKYAWFGLVGGVMMLKLTLLDQEEAPNPDEMGVSGKDYNEIFAIKVSAKELFYRRAKDLVSAYLDVKNSGYCLEQKK